MYSFLCDLFLRNKDSDENFSLYGSHPHVREALQPLCVGPAIKLEWTFLERFSRPLVHWERLFHIVLAKLLETLGGFRGSDINAKSI